MLTTSLKQGFATENAKPVVLFKPTLALPLLVILLQFDSRVEAVTVCNLVNCPQPPNFSYLALRVLIEAV